ncbi:methyltransferase family protein [Desulfoscipio geothermicus]|uniref:methyltransferase family protein n=1 Tax=Desulfoscipio geothermicus TaxID=39060 RepID=UPI000AD306BC|nr:isoprenylcysteine carboxylmethyltransferase family protein [Desulfoscipio geothermicus]
MGSNYPELNFFTHDAGHLWYTLFGFKGDPHTAPPHLLSNVLVFIGMYMIFSAWKALHNAQKNHTMVTTGLYAHVRHPQYVAFIMIMFAFLLQWPTLLTILMFPVLVFMYVRLARQEELDSIAVFGEQYIWYAEETPAFIPRIKRMKKVEHS